MTDRIDPISVCYNGKRSEQENRDAAERAMMRKIQDKYRATGWPKCERCKRNLEVRYATGIESYWGSGPYALTVSASLSCGYCRS